MDMARIAAVDQQKNRIGRRISVGELLRTGIEKIGLTLHFLVKGVGHDNFYKEYNAVSQGFVCPPASGEDQDVVESLMRLWPAP